MLKIQRYLSLASGLVVVGAMAAEFSRRPAAADAAPFHAAAAQAIGDVPIKFGGWEGTDVPVPTSAQALLKPNALLSRAYVNKSTNEQASLVVVQCRDTRDMAGHYPPVCYPGQGWAESADRRLVQLRLDHRLIGATRYQFKRSAFDAERTLVVYNFFALPGRGLPTDMDAIRRGAADYAGRPFGAAQVQIVLAAPNIRYNTDQEIAIVESLLSPLGPVVDVLSDPKWRP